VLTSSQLQLLLTIHTFHTTLISCFTSHRKTQDTTSKPLTPSLPSPSSLDQNSTAIPAIPSSKHDYTAQIAANLSSTSLLLAMTVKIYLPVCVPLHLEKSMINLRLSCLKLPSLVFDDLQCSSLSGTLCREVKVEKCYLMC
jgi:hypothetical protein